MNLKQCLKVAKTDSDDACCQLSLNWAYFNSGKIDGKKLLKI